MVSVLDMLVGQWKACPSISSPDLQPGFRKWLQLDAGTGNRIPKVWGNSRRHVAAKSARLLPGSNPYDLPYLGLSWLTSNSTLPANLGRECRVKNHEHHRSLQPNSKSYNIPQNVPPTSNPSYFPASCPNTAPPVNPPRTPPPLRNKTTASGRLS